MLVNRWACVMTLPSSLSTCQVREWPSSCDHAVKTFMLLHHLQGTGVIIPRGDLFPHAMQVACVRVALAEHRYRR